MTAMNVFNLILAIAVVTGLAVVCRSAHVLAGRTNEESAAAEAVAPQELKRAA
jgi:hypothetical protein